MKRCIAFADAAAKSEVMGPTETLLFGKQLPQNCRQPQNIANDVHRFHNFAVTFRHCACRSSHRPETPRSSRRLTQPTQKANHPVRFFILSLFCFKSFAYKKRQCCRIVFILVPMKVTNPNLFIASNYLKVIVSL